MPGRKPTPAALAAYKSQLQLLLGVLNGDISHLEAESAGQAQVDRQGDDGGVYSVEFSLDLLQRDEHSARLVTDALERIEEGAFGRCHVCEQWIKRDRLRAMPQAYCCIDCQRQAEAN